MKTSKITRIALAFAALSFLFVTVFSNPGKAFAQTVCSPATPITSPYAKDGVGDVCLQTTTLCDSINSWGMTTLEINGTSYTNLWAFGASIPPLNGTFTIRYVSTNPSSHFEIYAPCTAPTNTPSGPTATFTRTNTPSGPTATFTNTPIPSANLLTNANMEGGTTNWVITGAGTLSSDTSQFHGGAKSVKHTGRTGSWNGPGQNVAVSNFPTSGQNYTVSIWVRSETGTPTAKASLRLTASTTTYIPLATAGINSTGWTLLTGTTPVSWSGTLTAVLFFVETVAGTDNLYIDDASLIAGSVGPTATPTKTPTPTKTATPGSVNPNQVVNTYGRLQISGNQLRDQNGNAIQLAGMSSHGLTWFPMIDMNVNNATNMNTLKQQITFNPTGGVRFPHISSAVGNLVDQWHIQVVRASMFPYDPWNGAEAKSYDNAYPEWKWYNINLVNAIVQSAIDENIYVIIDWHAGEGNDQDPTQYWNSGHVQEFFTYMVDKWGSYPNVIYETVNSPVVSWNPTLKTFNQNVIDHIRTAENNKGYAYDNLIIAGTPTWSQDIHIATADPLNGNMIAYNYMWYAGTHYQMGWVQSRGDTALANLAASRPGQTVFMGEVGTSSSDGNNGVYYSNFNILMEWAKTRKLSWLNWSIANKEESSAIFKPAILGNITNNEIAWRGGLGGIAQAMASTGQPMRMGPWNDIDLSCSGKFVKGWMLYNTSQPTPAGC